MKEWLLSVIQELFLKNEISAFENLVSRPGIPSFDALVREQLRKPCATQARSHFNRLCKGQLKGKTVVVWDLTIIFSSMTAKNNDLPWLQCSHRLSRRFGTDSPLERKV